MLTLAYIFLAVVGCGYIVVATLLGHVSDTGDGGGAESASAHDTGGYGVAGSGHGKVEVGHAESAAFHFPFFSPLAVATLFTAFGAFGLMTKHALGLSDLASVATALPSAIAIS